MDSLSESEEDSFIHKEQQEKNTSSSSYLRRNLEPFRINLDSESNSEADEAWIMESWESNNTVTGNDATIFQESESFFLNWISPKLDRTFKW